MGEQVKAKIKLLTVHGLAERLDVHPSWVYRQLRQKGSDVIPHYRAGKYRRFEWEKVLDWMEAQG